MGASWLEVDSLIRETEKLFEFPHAEALPSVARARDMVAETAMVVSLAGLSDDPQAETEARALRARDRSRAALTSGRAPDAKSPEPTAMMRLPATTVS